MFNDQKVKVWTRDPYRSAKESRKRRLQDPAYKEKLSAYRRARYAMKKEKKKEDKSGQQKEFICQDELAECHKSDDEQ